LALALNTPHVSRMIPDQPCSVKSPGKLIFTFAPFL